MNAESKLNRIKSNEHMLKPAGRKYVMNKEWNDKIKNGILG